MQLGEIWTSGVHDNVVSGVILFVILGILGLALAWIRSWRMRNPWVWLVSNLREDMGLNLGAFICSLVLIATMTVVVAADLSYEGLYISLAVGVFSFLLFGWFSFFVHSTEPGSTKGLFYRHKAEPAGTSIKTSPRLRVTEVAEAGSVPSVVHPDFASKPARIKVLEALKRTQGKSGGAGATLVASMAAMEREVVAKELRSLCEDRLADVAAHEGDEITFAITSKGTDYLRDALLAM